MKRIYNFLICTMSAIALIAGVAPSFAADMVIYPGYISGTVAMGDFQTYSISTSAVGGGYRSTKNTSNRADYQLTVQGGNWDYTVTASAAVRGGNANTSVSFNTRTFPVGPGETVANDYDYNAGVIRFHVNINGDPYRYWRGYSAARKAMPSGQEKTSSSASTTSVFYDNGLWEMPVVANLQIPITARVYVYDPVYSGRNFNYDFGKLDIEPGQIIDVQIDIDYQKTPPPDTGDPNIYEYGYVEGSILLNNIEPQEFQRHNINYVGSIYENPGFYQKQFSLLNGTPRNYSFRAYTYFTGGYLLWPYQDGNSTNNIVRVEPTQITNKDFVLDSGMIAGNLELSGTVKNVDLAQLQMQITGNRFYTPGVGWTNTPSYGGTAYHTKTTQNMTEDYRVYLSEGPWQPYYFSAYKQQTQYNGYTRTNIYDYNYYYDGNSYTFGEPVEITAGETTWQDFEYCVGSIIFRFRDASGANMRNPTVTGTANIYNADNQRVMQISSQGYNSQGYVSRPEVEVFGPPANYSISSMQVYAADGSLIYYPAIQQEIECNVKKYFDIPGPDINVTAPQNELITNASSIAVIGTATGVTQIAGLTINDQAAPFASTGNPDDVIEIAFDYELPLNDGVNTIMSTVTDLTGAQASDERKVYADRWQPLVSIAAPVTGQLIWFADSVTAEVTASDRGYGYTLSVYLDNELIQQRDGAADETSATTTNYTGNLGVLALGDHILSARVVDRAGNSASASTTFTVFMDRWDPTVEIVTPDEGTQFVGCSSEIPLLVNATDQGNGFTLGVSLDGNEIYRRHGAGNLDAPVAISLAETMANLSNGSHTISAVATDLTGNLAEATTTFTTYGDCYPPSVEIISPADGSFFAAEIDEIPLNVLAADQGAGFTLTVYFDGQVVYTADGPPSLDTPATINFSDLVGPLAAGTHMVRATVNDLAGNLATAEATITAYQQADIVVKPESRNNKSNGVMTIFVKLPGELTARASLALADTAEISADPDQQPTAGRYADDENKLILKFKRTPELMADQIFTVQGRIYPDAENQNDWYYWRGSDTTRK